VSVGAVVSVDGVVGLVDGDVVGGVGVDAAGADCVGFTGGRVLGAGTGMVIVCMAVYLIGVEDWKCLYKRFGNRIDAINC
jgi:hypothetical protein